MKSEDGLQPLGKHFYRIEEDVFYIQFHRNVELKETLELTKLFDAHYAKHHRMLMICDLLNAAVIEADARRQFGLWAKNLHVMAIASIGANILQKAISVFMLNAIKIFTKGHFVQAFFDNETEARSWLAKQRTAFDVLQHKASQSRG